MVTTLSKSKFALFVIILTMGLSPVLSQKSFAENFANDRATENSEVKANVSISVDATKLSADSSSEDQKPYDLLVKPENPSLPFQKTLVGRVGEGVLFGVAVNAGFSAIETGKFKDNFKRNIGEMMVTGALLGWFQYMIEDHCRNDGC